MKKLTLIVLMLLAALPALPAHAEAGPLTLLLAGSGQDDAFSVALTPDGREYTILSTAPLEVGGDLCSHPEEADNELVCKAAAIAGFEVNAGGGDDSVDLSGAVPVPATIRGGPGADRLIGGAASDKIIGGPDRDVLVGGGGDDWILGGPGPDRLVGGPGNDLLRGGPDKDRLIGGPGQNELVP